MAGGKMPANVKAMLAGRAKKKSGGRSSGSGSKRKGSLHPKFVARMGNPKGK
jgi:hypothetical protein